jgi:hypothetical protein
VDPSWWDGARNSIFLYFQNFRLFDADAEIDRAVGSPWDLKESTALKLKLLPIYVRYPIYSALAGNTPRMEPLILEHLVPNEGGIPDGVYGVQQDQAASQEVKDQVARTLGNTLSSDEIIDFAVYALSQYSFFPQDEAGWKKLKRAIVNSDVYIAAAVILAGAYTDQGSLNESGNLVNLKAGGFKLGWYGSVRDLGIHFHPKLRAGLNASIPGLEMSMGMSHHIHSEPNEEKTALEVAVRESWLNRFAQPGGWDVYAEAGFRYVTDKGDEYTGPTAQLHTGLHASKHDIFGLKDVDFHASSTLDTDFSRNLRLALSLAVEDTDMGVAGILQGSSVTDPVTGSTTYQAGFFLAGTFESDKAQAESWMRTKGRALRDEIAQLERYGERADALGERLGAFGTDPSARSREREDVRALGEALAGQESSAIRLGARLADYLEARKAYAHAAKLKGWDDENHGILEPEELVGTRDIFYSRMAGLGNAILADAEVAKSLNERWDALTEALKNMPANGGGPGTLAYRATATELNDLGNARYQQALKVGHLTSLYRQLRDDAKRVDRASNLHPYRDPDPLGPEALRRAQLLGAQ